MKKLELLKIKLINYINNKYDTSGIDTVAKIVYDGENMAIIDYLSTIYIDFDDFHNSIDCTLLQPNFKRVVFRPMLNNN